VRKLRIFPVLSLNISTNFCKTEDLILQIHHLRLTANKNLSTLFVHVLLTVTTFAEPRSEDDLARRSKIFSHHTDGSTINSQSYSASRFGRLSASTLKNITNNTVEASTNVKYPSPSRYFTAFSMLLLEFSIF
jgi:hypothetical protein